MHTIRWSSFWGPLQPAVASRRLTVAHSTSFSDRIGLKRRYCENGALSIDNNLSERMVRPIAIGRKNWMFLGSDNGGKADAILYSIMASAKSNQVESFRAPRLSTNRLCTDQVRQ